MVINMNLNKDIGKYGETLANSYLRALGFSILKENFRNRFGEIDIIANKNNLLIFVEVKTRFTKSYGTPSESVTRSKQKNIIKLSKYFLLSKRTLNYFIRYDVIEVLLNSKDDNYKINHIENAFYS